MIGGHLPKTVVTGAAGRIGKAIMVGLRQGAEGCTGIDMHGAADIRALDIRDTDQLASLFEGHQLVIHCAGLHAPHVDKVPDEDFRSINVGGTLSVIRAARLAGVERLVLTSTTALYGGGSAAGEDARWIEDNSDVRVRTIYHETKLEAEHLVRTAAQDGLPASIVRLGRCFPESRSTMILHRLSRGIDEEDAAWAHIKAAQATSSDPQPVIAVARTPFKRSDCRDLGTRADELIRVRCPSVAAYFDAQGWTLPRHVDRIYCSMRAWSDWGWEPTKGPEVGPLDRWGTDAVTAPRRRHRVVARLC
ncbi:NAD-dependent epimerase/dehydratase family protein [Roseobacter weihaiensis]|uniref:NAD-dependent epimerase/dehydratase family protein n=1 Tax=Roseobacter weihaiensis TaxID=2763262 RepID=UPI001D0AADDF|nr:NAD(P)-dependent oxidoreductase [Roseobacter sp. H9]